MPGSSFGRFLKISTFGESHGPAVGVVVDGLPPGLEISEQDVQIQMDRRKPGQSDLTTPRTESDLVSFLSGVFEGKTTGAPMAMMLRNTNVRSRDYANIHERYRPGHADFTYDAKYGFRDWRGSGRASGRETAARVAAGAVARKWLEQFGVHILAWVDSAAGIHCESFDESVIESNPMRACDAQAAEKMAALVRELAEKGDSAGGTVRCRISGVPAGLGDPAFDKMEADLGKAMLSIGAVRGFEMGSGFAASEMQGSEHNDGMTAQGFLSNHAGGVIGGITTGQNIEFRTAVKPTSSISLPQKTRDKHGEEVEIRTEGRHDPIICPRIVPVIEAMAALTIMDHWLGQRALRGSDFSDSIQH
ncbi:MAG: chorismate synthase [Spirochaetales bacterium]|nr:chorismate synthase [Spirochaetales bacterium]